MTDATSRHSADIAVIGAGQAGLSAAHHLLRQGFVDAADATGGDRTFVIFDANAQPGGAWQHRWESLRMGTVNGIFDLPSYPQPPIDEREPSRDAVPRYFTAFERARGIQVRRPTAVTSVRPLGEGDDAPLEITTDRGVWVVRAVINATGTWNNPVRPAYPGADTFDGVQLHTRDYRSADDFRGMRVAVVGGGISAFQHLEEISQVTNTVWYTRREPTWLHGAFEPETTGRDVIARVTADAEAGRPTGSVVSYTGLLWNAAAADMDRRGVLDRHPMFTAIEPGGVREADGTFTPVDVILWATGFRADLRHLDPLRLRNDLGGITVKGTRVVGDPRVHLIGFGPSQSTVGANRAGRAAVAELVRRLDRHPEPVLAT